MASESFEKTVALVSSSTNADVVLAAIKTSGLTVLLKKTVRLRPDQAERFFDVVPLGTFDALILSGFDAVARWSDVVAMELDATTAYGSGDVVQAGKDVRFLFPEVHGTDHLSSGTAREFLSLAVAPVLVKGLIGLSREKPAVPVLWLADWLLQNRPYEY